MLRILIVDDDRNLCQCLLKLINWSELDCKEPAIAYNGAIAWEMINKQHYDLIICDLNMPVIGGAELCRMIKEKYPDTDTVFLSAHEDFEIARQALQYGVADYILKPINRKSLDNLKRIIQNTASGKAGQRWISQLFAGAYNEIIFNAIYEQDAELIKKLFEDMPTKDGVSVLNICIYLLRILYDYMCLLHESKENVAYEAMYRKWCSYLNELDTVKERISFVIRLYQEKIFQSDAESEAHLLVRRIKYLVKENYSRADCNVTWIAEQLHMSPAYVGRIFGKHMDVGLTEYILDCRMKQACSLLSKEEASVNEVATQIGYMDPNYFSKVFRNKLQMTPSEYRRKHAHIGQNYNGGE